MNANIKIPNKFLKVSSIYPEYHSTIGIVSNENDLIKAESMSGQIKWIKANGTTVIDDFKNNTDTKIVFFTNELNQLLDDFKINGFNVSKAGKIATETKKRLTIITTAPAPVIEEESSSGESLFTSVEMVEIVSKMNNEEVKLFMELKKQFPDKTDKEIDGLVFYRLHINNDNQLFSINKTKDVSFYVSI